jgi:BCD family chlorophyll transporter-like MFS transporter
MALGAWGAVQALAAGLAIATGGFVSDAISSLAASGRLGPALVSRATGYDVVYGIELILLLATMVAIGPLVRPRAANNDFNPLNFPALAMGPFNMAPEGGSDVQRLFFRRY